MAIFLQQTLNLNLLGDGTSTVFSFDLSKPPISVDSNGSLAFSVGVPSSVVPTVQWVNSPQIGLDVNSSPIYDQPGVTIGLVGTTLTVTFATALKLNGSTFTDGNSNQWLIANYEIAVTFNYNSLV